MKGLFEILIKKRLSVVIVLLSIFVGITLTYMLHKMKNKFFKFIPAFSFIIIGSVFLADGYTHILTTRGINSLYFAMIIGTSGVVSLFYSLILMNFNKK